MNDSRPSPVRIVVDDREQRSGTEELLSIKGIGKNCVEAIHWAVHEPEIEYGRFDEDSDPIL